MSRRVRCLGFAAPFVLVTACRPAPPVEAPEEDDEEEVAVAAPADAAEANAVIDAAPTVDAAIDAPVDAPLPPGQLPVGTIALGRNGSCHNFGSGTHCNPPRTPPAELKITARVVDVQVVGSDTMIVIAAGADGGVEKGQRGVVLDDGGQPRKDGEFRVLKVMKRTSYAKVSLTPAQLGGGPQVRLSLDPNVRP